MIGLIFFVLGIVHLGDSKCSITKRQLNQYRQDVLAEHNKLRQLHGVPDLYLDADINKYSQDWANKLARSIHLDRSAITPWWPHRPPNGPWALKFGENIITSGNTSIPLGVGFVSPMYHDEVHKWKWGSNGRITSAQHFTQIVWKNTCKLGIGFSFYPDCSGQVSVFNYSPNGNYNSEYLENVRPKGSPMINNKCHFESSLHLDNEDNPSHEKHYKKHHTVGPPVKAPKKKFSADSEQKSLAVEQEQNVNHLQMGNRGRGNAPKITDDPENESKVPKLSVHSEPEVCKYYKHRMGKYALCRLKHLARLCTSTCVKKEPRSCKAFADKLGRQFFCGVVDIAPKCFVTCKMFL